MAIVCVFCIYVVIIVALERKKKTNNIAGPWVYFLLLLLMSIIMFDSSLKKIAPSFEDEDCTAIVRRWAELRAFLLMWRKIHPKNV